MLVNTFEELPIHPFLIDSITKLRKVFPSRQKKYDCLEKIKIIANLFYPHCLPINGNHTAKAYKSVKIMINSSKTDS